MKMINLKVILKIKLVRLKNQLLILNTDTISTAPTNTINTINKTSSKKTTKSTKKASSPLRKNIHVDANKNNLIF